MVTKEMIEVRFGWTNSGEAFNGETGLIERERETLKRMTWPPAPATASRRDSAHMANCSTARYRLWSESIPAAAELAAAAAVVSIESTRVALRDLSNTLLVFKRYSTCQTETEMSPQKVEACRISFRTTMFKRKSNSQMSSCRKGWWNWHFKLGALYRIT